MNDWEWEGLTSITRNNVEVARIDMTKFTIHSNAQGVGCWVIGKGLFIYVHKRPRWLTRFLMQWLVEWEWEDKV